jgi:gluconolactonase
LSVLSRRPAAQSPGIILAGIADVSEQHLPSVPARPGGVQSAGSFFHAAVGVTTAGMTDRAYLCAFIALLGCAACGNDPPQAVDQPVDCSALPETLEEPKLLTDGLVGSEDIAIDAYGKFVARKGTAVVLVDEALETEEIVADFPASTGMRFMNDGSLAIGDFAAGKVVKLAMDGTTEDLVTDVPGANGVFADIDGRVWVTASSAGKLVVREANGDVRDVATGLAFPNGVVYDEKRKAVFVNELTSGTVYRINIDEDGNFADKVEVGTLPTSALPDGQALDICGNLYVISFGGKKLFRIQLDLEGNPEGEPEDLATFPGDVAGDVANPVFARGREDLTELYVTGSPGNIYRIDVGMESAKNAP